MAQEGSSSIIFEKTFSASSYSKECSSSIARLKCCFSFWLQEVSNSTEPNCLSAGSQEMISPLLRPIESMFSFDGPALLSLHDSHINDNTKKYMGCTPGDNFLMRRALTRVEGTICKGFPTVCVMVCQHLSITRWPPP